MTVPLQLHASDGKQLNGKGGSCEHGATEAPKKHETTTLGDLRPCLFPDLDATSAFNGRWQSTEVPFRDTALLHSFCQEHGVSSFAVLQLAWAMVLRCYLGSESVSFGCNVSSGETIINGLKGTYNPSVNNSACYVDFEGMGSLLELLRVMQANLSHTRSQRALSLFDADGQASKRDPPLFDTAMSYQEIKQQDCSITNKPVFPNGAGQGLGKVINNPLGNHLFIKTAC